MKNNNRDDLNQVIESLKTQVNLLKKQLSVTEKEKKAIRKESRRMSKQFKQQRRKSSGAAALSERDLQIVNMASERLQTKMLNLDNLHNQLSRLHEEENVMTERLETLKRSMAESAGTPNNEAHDEYGGCLDEISDLKLKKMEIENKIKFSLHCTAPRIIICIYWDVDHTNALQNVGGCIRC